MQPLHGIHGRVRTWDETNATPLSLLLETNRTTVHTETELLFDE